MDKFTHDMVVSRLNEASTHDEDAFYQSIIDNRVK